MRKDRTANWLILPALSLLLAAGHAASADEDATPRDITLDGLIQRTLVKSPAVQAKKHAYEAAKARVFSAWLPDDPEFGMDAEGQPSLFHIGQRTDT